MQELASLAGNRDEIVSCVSKLIAFNTTVPNVGQRPVDERKCQDFIAEHLARLGGEVDVWEPDVEKLMKYPNFIQGRTYEDRPIVVAKLPGTGGGRSLILNFHIDVAPAHLEDGWKFDPFSGTVANGRLYGRGAADMKGGAGAVLKALEAINQAGFKLRGDVIVESVTDEEINGMGTIACIERGYRADAAIVPEPTELNVYAAMLGTLHGWISVEGRRGWPLANPDGTVAHWTRGGPVNAIEKALLVIRALKELEAEWSSRPTKAHELLPTPRINITQMHGGEFGTIPGECRVRFVTGYLPSEKDQQGFGSLVKKEIEDQILRTSATDFWMRQHPPKMEWTCDIPGTDVAMRHPIVENMIESAAELGMKTRVRGLECPDDVSALANWAGVPGIEFGPGSNSQAHIVDEFVSLDELVQATRILAIAICNWCGVS